MKNQISYSPEVRERAVRLVFEQQKEHESQCIRRQLTCPVRRQLS